MPTQSLGKNALKFLAHVVLLASLPFLSGCFSAMVIQTARSPIETRLYDSADKIAAADISGDNRLFVFFEKNSTNPAQNGRFTLAVPLSEITTNTQGFQAGDFTVHHRDRSREKKHFSFAVLQVPGGVIRSNWTALETPGNDLKSIPVGPTPIQSYGAPVYLYKVFTVLSNATQTVYLTRTNPIEFAYVDSSLDRSFNVVSVQPIVIRRTQPGYYALLPITVPFDVATAPIQGVGLLFLYFALKNMKMGC